MSNTLIVKMTDQDKSKRKKWTRTETLMFLKCYSARKSEYEHYRKKKKKFAYANVLEDMVFHGFNDPAVIFITLEAKMRTLLTAYKSAKDNARRTGASPCIGPYLNEMDEIFGDKPIVSNVHTLNLGTGPTQPLRATSHLQTVSFDESSSPSSSSPPTVPTSLPAPPTPSCSPPSASTPLASPPTAPTPSCSPPSASTLLASPSTAPLAVTGKRHRKTAKERYYEAKLAQMETFLKDIKEMLREKWKAQEEIEKQKLELIQKFLN